MNYLQRKKLAFMKLLNNIKSALGYPVVIQNAKESNAVDYTIYGNTVQENLLTYPFVDSTKTVSGITFTDNGDGTITANGTATGDARFILKQSVDIPKYGNYFLSGCPANGGTSKYYIHANAALNGTYVKGFFDEGQGIAVDLSNINYNKISVIAITIKSGITANNMVFEPKLISSKFVGDKTKNLIDVQDVNKTVAGVTYKGSADGTVTMNGTKYGQGTAIVTNISIPLKKNTSYTLSALYENFPLDNNFYIYLYSGEEKISELPITLTKTSVNLTEDTAITSVRFGISQDNVIFSNAKVKLQLEENTAATDYEPYGYKIPLSVSKGNILPYPYHNSNRVNNGITYTDNGDGTITANGTATAHSHFYVTSADLFTLGNKKYTLSGCPKGGSTSTYYAYISSVNGNTFVKSVNDTGDGVVIDFTNSEITGVTIGFTVRKGATVNNATINFKLEEEPERVNVYHSSQLAEGESINYKTDNLPALPLNEGYNEISAETDVKPEKIDIRYESR